MPIAKLTPILIVQSIEECLPLWRTAMGYEVASEVKHGDRLGFVILKQDGSELMLQSKDSLGNDLPALNKCEAGAVFFYADVPSLDEALLSLSGATIVVPRRKTFYGADEVWIRTASGHVLGLAQFVA